MLSRRSLRAMRDRWERDLDRLEAAYETKVGELSENGDDSVETIRNLASAIAHVEGLIATRRTGDHHE
jgi:hypothetical protein